MLVIGLYGLAGIVGAVWAREPGLLLVLAAAMFLGALNWWRYTWKWKLTWPVTRKAVQDRIGEEGVLILDESGMEIRHPVLWKALHLTWNDLRAFAVEAPVRPGANGLHRGFPIERTPGSLRVIGSEPRHFLTSTHAGGSFTSVRLAGIDLGSLRPDVAVLFSDPQDVRIAAPAFAPQEGWQPPERSIPTIRTWRDMRILGAYLRVLDWERLAAGLEANGVRNGFNSDDWRHATRTPTIERTP